MNIINSKFLELIQIALGNRAAFSEMPTHEEWTMLYEMAKKQAVEGICYYAISNLGMNGSELGMDRRQIGKWYNASRRIAEANKEQYGYCHKLQKYFGKYGFSSCILKGQGNSLLYPDPFTHTPGDVDIWLWHMDENNYPDAVDVNRQKVINLVKKKLKVKTVEARIHHVEFMPINDTPVEVHYLPMFFYSFTKQRRFEKWCVENVGKQCNNIIDSNVIEAQNSFNAPTAEFNAVFQLSHILRHLFEEGIGIRQIIDYYYVLKALDSSAKEKVITTIRNLGMCKLAGALMWVLKEALAMDEQYLLCKPNEKLGRLLLDEIMIAGNFGHFDERFDKWRSRGVLYMFIGKMKFNMRLWRLSPEEILMGPFFRIWHYLWRKKNGYLEMREV